MTSVLEGATHANPLHGQTFVEHRKYTSAQGVTLAAKLKSQSRGFDYYSNKYAQAQFIRPSRMASNQ